MLKVNNLYYELKLQINPEIEDLIAEIFFENFDCDGIVMAEESYKDLELIATTEGTLRIFIHNDCGNSYEDLKYDIENILDISREEFLSRGLSEEDLGSWEFTLEEKQNEDWSKKWKEKWDVTHVSEKIAVVPDWIEYEPKEGEIIIKIEPGCAFGTGTHQTTQLCMKALEKYMRAGDKVADIGMVSGILSILARKLGASFIYGCDTDETVIDVAKKNAIKNNLPVAVNSPIEEDVQSLQVMPPHPSPLPLGEGAVVNEFTSCTTAGEGTKCCYFELGSADKIKDKFDFVVANILHFVLAEIMPDLKNIMKIGAMMSLSGILDEKKQMVIDAYENAGLELVEEIKQDQWTSFVVKRVD